MTPYTGTQRLSRIRTMICFQCGISMLWICAYDYACQYNPWHGTLVERFRRFLDTHAVRVCAWYRPYAIHLLQATYQATGHMRLILFLMARKWGIAINSSGRQASAQSLRFRSA